MAFFTRFITYFSRKVQIDGGKKVLVDVQSALVVLLLLNIEQRMRTDWEHFSRLDNGVTRKSFG